MSSKSSRWLQRDWFSCGLCNNVQKHIRGYKPIPNPILFNPEEQCRAWAREQKDSVGYIDQHFMKKCDQCKTLHGSWQWIDFQEALKKKEMQQQQLGKGGSKKVHVEQQK